MKAVSSHQTVNPPREGIMSLAALCSGAARAGSGTEDIHRDCLTELRQHWPGNFLCTSSGPPGISPSVEDTLFLAGLFLGHKHLDNAVIINH